MYVSEAFDETREDVLHSLIRTFPLAIIVANSTNGLDANHIPLYLSGSAGDWLLQGHIAKANPLWRSVTEQSEVLAIFQGPQHYISPNWYPSKTEHGKAVPTWNYATVHVYGTIRWIHDSQWLREFLTKLTDTMEQSQPHPWKLSDAPHDYINLMLNGIVGLEIQVTRTIGKWKVSQNRESADRHRVVSELNNLQTSDAHAMAKLVEKHANE